LNVNNYICKYIYIFCIIDILADDDSDREEYTLLFRSILNRVEQCWVSLEQKIVEMLAKRNLLASYNPKNEHPCFKYINAARIPTEDGNKSAALILHGLPEADGKGYVDEDTIKRMTEAMAKREWFMLIGTSGAGKTRSIYELLCRTYGIYLTLHAGKKYGNMGSRDLDIASDNLKLSREDPKRNSKIALSRVRAVLAARLFVLQKLLPYLTPKKWLLIQLLPGCIGLTSSDFWVDLWTVFVDSRGSDLKRYINETTTAILARVQQPQLPVAIDEAQAAISLHANLFHATRESIHMRSFFAILLRAVLELSNSGLRAILSGTGLRIADVRSDYRSMRQ